LHRKKLSSAACVEHKNRATEILCLSGIALEDVHVSYPVRNMPRDV
jgi:hypothetical protein